MYKASLLLFITLLFGTVACDFIGGQEKTCEAVGNELTDDNVEVPTALFRTGVGFSVSYTPGECDIPDSYWTVPGSDKEQVGVFQYAGLHTYGGEFTESGDVCVTLGKGTGASNTICKNLEVITEDVWSFTPTVTYPGTATNRTITLSIDGFIFAGFGEVNEWYRFDTEDWIWEERAGVDLATFEAYTGFTLNNKAYIFGQNSFLYEYNSTTDSWTSVSEFKPLLQETFQLEQQSNTNNSVDFLYPFIGVGIGNKGYIGVGGSGRFFEYDMSTKAWTELASYPEPGLKNANYFVYNNKIYLGAYFFDPLTGTWEAAPARYSENEFNKFFAVYDDGVYFLDSKGTTRRFNGETTTDYSPRTLLHAERPGVTGIATTATIGEITIIPKSWNNQRKMATFTFYKRK